MFIFVDIFRAILLIFIASYLISEMIYENKKPKDIKKFSLLILLLLIGILLPPFKNIIEYINNNIALKSFIFVFIFFSILVSITSFIFYAYKKKKKASYIGIFIMIIFFISISIFLIGFAKVATYN